MGAFSVFEKPKSENIAPRSNPIPHNPGFNNHEKYDSC